MFNFPTAEANNPAVPGSSASAPMLFGPHKRFCLFAVHTRFDAVEWFVADAETLNPVTKAPEIIRQEATAQMAVDSLGDLAFPGSEYRGDDADADH